MIGGAAVVGLRALAREHWKPLAKAIERLDRMWVQQGMYEAETVGK